MQQHLHVRLRIAQAVNRRHGGNDDRIGALQNRLGRRQPHLLDVLVDRGVLLDVGVGGGDVGFRLVVVVIGDEIFHRVVREKFLHLAVQLRRQSLVRGQHQRRTLHGGDNVSDGKGFARPRNSQQGLMRQTVVQAGDERVDGLGLVAGGLETGAERERFVRLHGKFGRAGISSIIRQSR